MKKLLVTISELNSFQSELVEWLCGKSDELYLIYVDSCENEKRDNPLYGYESVVYNIGHVWTEIGTLYNMFNANDNIFNVEVYKYSIPLELRNKVVDIRKCSELDDLCQMLSKDIVDKYKEKMLVFDIKR